MEYIKVPKWFSVNSIDSENLVNFYKEADFLENDKINLDFLRRYFLFDRAKALDIKDELSLRGFEFHYNGVNNLLPNNRFNIEEEVIINLDNSNKFRNVNYHLLGLGNFLKRFNVKSDYFFNLIPITGFETISKFAKESLIKNELTKAGFIIYSSNVSTNSDLNLEYRTIGVNLSEIFQDNRYNLFVKYFHENNINNLIDIKMSDIKSIKGKFGIGLTKFNEFRDILLKTFITSSYTLNIDQILIEEVFSENKFNIVRKYFNLNKKKYIQDVNMEDVIRFRDFRGVGDNKYDIFKNKLLEFYISPLRYNHSNIELLPETQVSNGSIIFDIEKYKKGKESFLETCIIKDILIDGNFNLIRKYCQEKKIKNFNNLTNKNIIEISNIKGVGKKKLHEFIEIIKETNSSKNITQYGEGKNNLRDVNNFIYDIDTKKKGLEEFLTLHPMKNIIGIGKFNLILDYCIQKRIATVNDLSNKDIVEISNIRGIGKKKLTEFFSILDDIIEASNDGKKKSENGIFNLDKNIFTVNKDFSLIEISNLLGIDIGIKTGLYIGDIQDIRYSEIADTKLLNNIKLIINKLSLTKDLNEIVRDAYNKLDEKESITIIARYVENMTLQETGEVMELTRERVRQIQKKAIRKINSSLKRDGFIDSLKLSFKSNSIINLEDLINKINVENHFLVGIIKNGELINLSYNQTLDIIYFNTMIDKIEVIDNIINDLPDFGELDEYIDLLSSSLKGILNLNLSDNQANNLLIERGFKIYGKYASRSRLTISNILELLFKYHIRRPMQIDESSFSDFMNVVKKIFKMDFKWNQKSVDGRIRDIHNILLTNSNTFCHIDHLNNNIFFMNQVRLYIDDYLVKHKYINAERIFDVFNDSCIENGIDNKYYLYSLIRYNFNDYYNIGRGNTLTITTKGKLNNQTNEEILYEYLCKNDGIETKEKVLEKFHWSKLVLENTITNSSRFISFDLKKVALIERIFKDNKEKEALLELIEECMEEGFTTTVTINNKVLFDDGLSNIIIRNKINESSTLGNIARHLNPNITGNTVFLSYKNSEYKSIYDVIMSKFPGNRNRKELYDYLVYIGYAPSTSAIIIRNLIEENYFKQISMDDLVNINDFSIESDVVQALIQMIETRIMGEEYISLSGLKHYRKQLPEIKHKWNPYLIKSILIDNGFKDIIRKNGDYRIDCVIVLKESSKLNTFDELVYHLLKNDYEGNLHEKPVYEYLVSLNLVKETGKYNRRLPWELYNSDFMSIDKTGRIHLNEVVTCQISD